MATRTRSEKEKEVANEIEKRAEDMDVVHLRKETLVKELSDEQYSESDIREIIEDLVEKSPFKVGKINMDVIYPAPYEDDLFKDMILGVYIPTWMKLTLGGYLFLLFVFFTNIFDFVLGISNSNVLIILITGGASSYLLGSLAERTAHIAERQVPIIRQYRLVIYPFIFLTSVSYLIVGVVTTTSNAKIPVAAMGSIPATSLLAAAAFATLIKKYDFGADYRD